MGSSPAYGSLGGEGENPWHGGYQITRTTSLKQVQPTRQEGIGNKGALPHGWNAAGRVKLRPINDF